MRTLGIAAIQTKPVFFDVDATWRRFADQVRSIRDLFGHVQVVVAPELLLAAEGPLLDPNGPDMKSRAEPIPGPLTARLGKLAKETGLWLVPGSMFERAASGEIFNTAVVVDPGGEVVARYRKIFPWQPYERSTPGSTCTIVDLDGIGRIGLAICYDGSFPEIPRQLAWLGAEVIIQPTLTTTRDRAMEMLAARVNAWSNQVYVVNVNGSDPAGLGQSLIVDPEGMVRQQAGGGEEVLVDVLDLEAVTRVRQFGSTGINRPWDQITRYGTAIKLPMYEGGTMQPPPWAVSS